MDGGMWVLLPPIQSVLQVHCQFILCYINYRVISDTAALHHLSIQLCPAHSLTHFLSVYQPLTVYNPDHFMLLSNHLVWPLPDNETEPHMNCSLCRAIGVLPAIIVYHCGSLYVIWID